MSESTAVSLPVDAVTAIGDHATTTSIKVAETFKRNHRDVMRAIREFDFSSDFHARNFALMSHDVVVGNGATRADPYYQIQKDGFVLLVMGFTGRQALAFKIAYIQAFNALEAQLHQHAPDVVAQIQAELLRSNPLLAKVHRYDRLGLSEREIARLINRSHDTVGRQRARLTRCGLRPAA